MRRQVLAVFLTVMVIASGMPIAPIGTAAATHECEGLSEGSLDYIVAGFTWGHVNERCLPGESHEEIVVNMTNNDADQTRSDVYQEAKTTDAAESNLFTWIDNYLQDTDGAIWMDVEIDLARGYESGNITNTGDAEAEAGESVQDQYSVHAINLIERWNITVAEAKRLENVTDSEQNVSDGFHEPEWNKVVSSSSRFDGVDAARIAGFTTKTVTLPNGTQHTARAVVVEGKQSFDGGTAQATVGPTDGATVVDTYPSGSDEYHINFTGLKVQGPTADDGNVTYLSFDDYSTRYSEINSKSSSLHAEAQTFANVTYDAFDSGQINATDLINRNTAMFQLAADEIHGDNTLYRSTAAASLMGVETPELNGTGTMEVEYGGQTYNGLVLAEQAPNGGWEANTTYDSANLSEPLFMVTTNGEKKDLNGTFTIGTISNESGDPIQQVNHTRVVYKTSNTSETLDKMLQLLEYRQEVENRDPLLGGGGGGPLGGSTAVVAAIAVIAALLLKD